MMADRPRMGSYVDKDGNIVRPFPGLSDAVQVHTTGMSSGEGATRPPAPSPDSHDLVVRLRDAADDRDYDLSFTVTELVREAATEIEHLRWAVGCLLRKRGRS